MSDTEDQSKAPIESVIVLDTASDGSISADEVILEPEPHQPSKTEKPRKTFLVRMLDVAPDGPLPADKGLLSLIGDPLGQVLDKCLRPIGYITGAIARPPGEALLAVQKHYKEEFGYADEDTPKEKKPEGKTTGGNPETSQNPLGL